MSVPLGRTWHTVHDVVGVPCRAVLVEEAQGKGHHEASRSCNSRQDGSRAIATAQVPWRDCKAHAETGFPGNHDQFFHEQQTWFTQLPT